MNIVVFDFGVFFAESACPVPKVCSQRHCCGAFSFLAVNRVLGDLPVSDINVLPEVLVDCRTFFFRGESVPWSNSEIG